MMESVLALLIVFIILLFAKAPIFLAMLGGALSALFIGTSVNLIIIPQTFYEGVNQFVLLAVPGFILAGKIMNYGGITKRLVDFSNNIVGHLKGGLGHVNIVVSMIMAGVSGAAVSDAASVSQVLIPAMEEKGYSTPFSVAITAASSTVGPIIPPSMMFILYGAITSVSVGKLFIAGAIPGFVMGFLLMIFVAIIARKENFPTEEKAKFKVVLLSLKNNIFALLMPLIVIGGLVLGIYTPTEAAAVAVFLSFLVSFIIYKELKISDLSKILKETALTSGSILVLVGAANTLGWVFAYLKISMYLQNWFMSISNNPIIIILIMNVVLLILGCFVDIMALLMILTPVLLPVINAVGIDLVHFGVVMVMNLMLGLITPPVGLVMFVTCNVANCNINDYIKSIWPFWIALLIALLCVSIFPQIALWLPNLILG